MEYIPLIEQLSELDKKRIENYICLYGNRSCENLPVEEWLKYWEHSNQKLFKILGNSLIKEIPIKFEKNEHLLENDLYNLRSKFYYIFNTLLNDFADIHEITGEQYEVLKCLLSNHNLTKNALDRNGVKIVLKNGKVLQVQRGMKIAKAIEKIFMAQKPYMTEDFNNEFNEKFKEFKNAHSIILNEKYINGTLCFSIHPLDYITMSDNSFNWSSCMSWTSGDGCYRVGTIEMMNSNNVICAYIKSNNQIYDFSKEHNSSEEEFHWNTKKWRQLFYVTKDIIVNGKSYPFAMDEVTQESILKELKNLVEQNMGWTYAFGPEYYLDMVHINSKYRMDKNRDWIFCNNTRKHNIIFDTKGMYNDFLNDSNFTYLCFRNKVKRNKIISVSGKGNCICCNSSLTENREDSWNDDYNDRFSSTGEVLCDKCLENVATCCACSVCDPTKEYIKIKSETGNFKYVCESCFKNYFKCPLCENTFYFDSLLYIENKNRLWIERTENKNYQTRDTKLISDYLLYEHFIKKPDMEKEDQNILFTAACCPDCYEKILKEEKYYKIQEIKTPTFWGAMRNPSFVKIITDKNLADKMFYKNLKCLEATENKECNVSNLPHAEILRYKFINRYF